MKKPRSWTTEKRRPIFQHPILGLSHLDLCAEPQADESGSRRRDALVIESNDWVNIIALRGRQVDATVEVVLIRQWRFGSASHTLEIPGGMVDDGETPEEAARRELEEETGYRCGRLDNLGVVQPNPALFNNRCHLFLAQDLVNVGEPEGDGDEEIEVLLRPLAEVPEMMKSGDIQHALVVAAFYFYGLGQTFE